jgi:hypothetical protein
MATYTFYPPQVMEGYPLADKWWRRVVSQRGIAVIIENGQVSLSRAVTEDELKDYDYVFLGGRGHIVNEATKDILVAQGFQIRTQAQADSDSNIAHNGFLVEKTKKEISNTDNSNGTRTIRYDDGSSELV